MTVLAIPLRVVTINGEFQLTDIYVLLVDRDFMSFPEFHLKCIVEN